MGSFETYIEIPVRVVYSVHRRVPATRHYPGEPGGIVIDAVEVVKENPKLNTDRQIENYAFGHYLDALTKECEQDHE